MITLTLLAVLMLVGVVYGLSRFDNYCRDYYNYEVLSVWNVVVALIAIVALVASAVVTTGEAPFLVAIGAALILLQWIHIWRQTSLICACLALIEIFAASAAAITIIVIIAIIVAQSRSKRRCY